MEVCNIHQYHQGDCNSTTHRLIQLGVFLTCLECDPSSPSNNTPSLGNSTIVDEMKIHVHDLAGQPTGKMSLYQQYLSLPSQHPLRFIGLCSQVFFYYLAYAYLQVSVMKGADSCRNPSICSFKELLFILPGFDKTAWFLTCYQFFVYGILAFAHMGLSGVRQRRYAYGSSGLPLPSFDIEERVIDRTSFWLR